MKYISVEQGKKYLSEVGLGTVSHIPGSTALLVTAGENEFLKAMTILNLVDSQGQFVVSTALDASVTENLPSNELIASKVGDISIGSFSNPPAVSSKARAIIDTHNGVVLVIAPVELVDRVLSTVRQLSGSGNGRTRIKPGGYGKLKGPKLAGPEVPGTHFASKGKITTQPNPVPTMLVLGTPYVEQEMPKLPAAVEPYEPREIPNGDDVLQLALPETLSITDFLGFVGEHLNLNYLYDPLKVKGDITLKRLGRLRGPIKIKELYPLLEQVLHCHGFVMTRRGNLVRIVPVAEALNIDPALIMGVDDEKIQSGDVIITRVFELGYVSTVSAKNLLEAMRLTLDVREITETQTIIVTGYAYRMPRIEALLDMVDRPGEQRKFRFRQLQYTMAVTLAPKIQTLAEQLGTISIAIAAAPTVPIKSSVRRPGETTAQWQARLRAEATVRLRATTRPSTVTKQLEPTKPTVFLDADERTNRILMIGLDELLDEVEELIDTLDVAQQDLRTLKLYKIEYVDAEEAKRKLEELGIITPIRTTGYPYSSTSRITGTTTRPTTIKTPTTTSRYPTTTGLIPERIEGEPQVVVVEPTNSLLVNATTEQHTRIAEIIRYVDSEMQEDDIPCQVYPLESQSPRHLKEILDPLIQETVLDKEGKIESVMRKQDEQITIVADPNTFSLIVYASKKNQDWISSLIEKLDKRRPQVLIDVTLVEVSKTDAFDYDLNLIQSFPDLVATSGLTGPIMPVIEGGSLVSKLLSSGRDRFVDFQSNRGVGIGFYGDRHINALLTAMQKKDYGRVLAKPKILVNDNEEGIINTKDTTYVTIQTGTIIEGVSTAVQTSVNYEPYEAGITLTITPHISRGDFLRLDIELERDDFGTITGEKPPDVTGSNISTTVTVPDGSTIILGGMLKLNQGKSGTKVPILGDIPFIGGLFRSTSNSDIQRNLYVFVKAEIIRPTDAEFAQSDLERISERNREAFEQHEIEFQEYRNWPGVKPKVMTPFKVLDAQ